MIIFCGGVSQEDTTLHPLVSNIFGEESVLFEDQGISPIRIAASCSARYLFIIPGDATLNPGGCLRFVKP